MIVLTENNNEQEPQEQKVNIPPKHKHSFRSAFFGGLCGGIIATIAILALFMNQLLPLDALQISAAEDQQNSGQTQETKNLQNAFSSDGETADLTNISEAVVGVINMQEQSLWTPEKEAGSGSGIIYKKSGNKAYVVTNNHVVDQAKHIKVQLYNEKKLDAKVIGKDAVSDLAVLEVPDKEINTVAEFGDSTKLNVGDNVIAIGNPLNMNLSGTVTKGIISGLNRSVPVDTTGNNQTDWETEVIQTDAAINPGNSGGALVTNDGKVVGINSMKVAQESVEGIGFSIPINTAKPIIKELETKGEVSRSYLGLSMANASDVPEGYQDRVSLPKNADDGVVVADVEDRSPAASAGLKQFDTIIKINDKQVHSYLDIKSYLYSSTKPNDKVTLTILRDGKTMKKSIKLGTVKHNQN